MAFLLATPAVITTLAVSVSALTAYWYTSAPAAAAPSEESAEMKKSPADTGVSTTEVPEAPACPEVAVDAGDAPSDAPAAPARRFLPPRLLPPISRVVEDAWVKPRGRKRRHSVKFVSGLQGVVECPVEVENPYSLLGSSETGF